MRSNTVRYHSSLIVTHWIIVFLIFASLFFGWYAVDNHKTDTQTREFVLGIHTSLGITIALLIFMQLIFWIAFGPLPYTDEFPRRQKIFARSLYFLIYASIILILISGYLQAVFSRTPVEFWGARMPNWGPANLPVAEFLGQFWGAPLRIFGAAEVTSADFFRAVHSLMAFIFIGLIFLHIGSLAIHKLKQPGTATTRMVALSAQQPSDAEKTKSSIASILAQRLAQRLAKNFCLFGWIEFSLQSILAIVTALLLEFATSGRAFSPGVAGYGDAVYWGICGFILLLFAVLLSFYYTRAARHIVSRPESYMSSGAIAFWFLFAGLLIGLLGVLISFTGVALSISLLIVKTVSQPPGIAITDPSKIVRALDVFVLLVNFILLMAHFIGAGIALWLGLDVSSTRLKYITKSQQHE
jgi:cytochrome b561